MKKSKLFVLPLMAILLLAGCDNNTSSTSSSTSSSAPESSASSAQVSSSAASSSTPSSVSSSSSSSSVSSSESSSSTSSSESSSSSSSSSEEEKVKHTFNVICYASIDATFTFDKADGYSTGDTVTYTIQGMASRVDNYNSGALIDIAGHKIAFNVEVSGSDLVGSFIMPEVGDKTEVDFIVGMYDAYTTEATDTDKTVTLDVTDGLVAFLPSSLKQGTNLYSFGLYRSKTMILTKVSYKIGDGDFNEVNITYTSWYQDFTSISLSASITDDITIKVEAKEVSAHSLTIVGGEYVTFSQTPSSSYIEGETVSFYYTPISGVSVTCKITTEDGEIQNSGYSTNVSFTMPGKDVTITFTATAYPTVTIEADNNISSYKIFARNGYYYNEVTDNKVAPGSEFYVVAVAKEGFKLGTAYFKGAESAAVIASYQNAVSATAYSFTAPSDGNDFTIVINAVSCGTITITEDTTHFSEVSVKDSVDSSGESSLNSFGAGDTFVLFPTVNTGFVLTGATISDGTSSEAIKYDAKVKYGGTRYVECKMPENGVANVTFTFATAHTVTLDADLKDETKVRANFESNTSTFAEGDTVKIELSVQFGYELSKIELVNGDITTELTIQSSYSGKYVEFIMPDGDVSLKSTIVESEKISIDFSYKNESVNRIPELRIYDVNNQFEISKENVATSEVTTSTNTITVGNKINVSITAFEYDSSGNYSVYLSELDVKLTITYNDNTSKDLAATFSWGFYEINSVEITNNIKSMSLVISDKAAA